MDAPGAGNACHKYSVFNKPTDPNATYVPEVLGTVSFQNGPIIESGVNGVQNEDLLAIVIHRLQGFQSGPYKCDANQVALDNCQLALNALEARTKAREARGVEGTHAV